METPLLNTIGSPEDLQNLSIEDLDALCDEVREKLIDVVSKTGGHLAPSLGVVELTLALHYVFDSPRDKIVWDVGHQSYVHKLVTGRLAEFEKLRQYEGLSGFPKRTESPHDPFDTGHSSTSISAIVGMALARDLNKEDYNVIAVIGDGALTGGMSFEALNHVGHLGTNLIVVLNDNEMSIAENVGAMSRYLSRMRTDPVYNRQKEDVERLLKKIPTIGPTVFKAIDRIKDSFKYLVVPGMIFEELGFTYLGPIDGHNITDVKNVLERAKMTKGPVMVHVLTQKGKGYKPAVENPDRFHGIGPFNVNTGEALSKSSVVTYTEIFGKTLCELASKDEKILAITAAMPTGTGLTRFAELFPDRFFDVGIAEQHAVTMAAGMATTGFRPVVAIYSTFFQRAYDQILHDVAMQNLPVTFAIDRAGIVGEDGETHQGIYDFAYLRHIPNMVVMAPKDENELRSMLKTGLTYEGPISLRYPRGSGIGVEIFGEVETVPIGKAEVLREGSDLTLLAVGPLVYDAMEAAEELANSGIDAAVVNCRFVKPLDEGLILEFGRKTGRVITIEEHALAGGFGSAVLELLQQHGLRIHVERIGLPDKFIEQGASKIIRQKFGLSKDNIVATGIRMASKRKLVAAKIQAVSKL